MKMNAKRSLVSVMAAVMVLTAVLTGCSGKQNTQTAAATPAAEAKATAAATAAAPASPQLKPYELEWYLIGNGQPKETALVEAEVNKVIKEKINATIKFYVIPWGDFSTKIGAMTAASEKMDIIFTADWKDYASNVAKGAFLPLNDLMNKYAPKTKELLGDSYIKGTQINGVNYGLPTNKELGAMGGVMFNKKYLEKYGFDVSTIKKLEDVEPWLKTIKEKEAGVVPFGVSWGNSFKFFGDFTTSISGDGDVPVEMYLDGRDTKVYNIYERPETKRYLDLLRKFNQAGYIEKEAATVAQKFNDHLSNGTAFMVCQPLKPGKDAEMSNDKVTWVQAPLRKAYITSAEPGSSMQAIAKTSKDPERAMMFLEILNTNPAVNNLFAYGVEGKHYTKVSDKVIKVIPDNGWNLNMNWALANQFLNYLKDNEDPKKWEKFAQFNKESTPVKALGFRLNTEPFQAEYAAIKNVSQKYYPVLDCGAVDVDTYLKKMNDEYKAAGIDKVIAGIQKSFDEWYAKNGK